MKDFDLSEYSHGSIIIMQTSVPIEEMVPSGSTSRHRISPESRESPAGLTRRFVTLN